MSSHRRAIRSFGSMAVLFGAITMGMGSLHASIFTVACGTAFGDGSVGIGFLIGPRPPYFDPGEVIIPIAVGTDGATKCSQIAVAIMSDPDNSDGNNLPLVSAVAQGSTMLLTGNDNNVLQGITYGEDGSNEINKITMNPGPAENAVFVENFAGDLASMAPSGTFTVSGGKTDANGSRIAFSAAVTTTSTESIRSIVDQLNSQAAAQGFAFDTPILDPVTGNSKGFETRPFDPATVEIDWNGSTGASVANFGIVSIPTPEPDAYLLVGPGVIALASRLRKRREAAKAICRAGNSSALAL
jgi:hypothetical protein